MSIITPERHELMLALDPVIAMVTKKHEAGQRLWWPSELIPENHAPSKLPPEVMGMLILNVLTEDGLPLFLTLLATHLGTEHAIWNWSKLWAAEENRHGAVLDMYLDRSLTQPQKIAVEQMRYQYLKAGFEPTWGGDPLKLMAYVVLQERATQYSHRGLARQVKDSDPVLAKILGLIAAEEQKHHYVYSRFFVEALKLDVIGALHALNYSLRKFAMPGETIPHFTKLAQAQERAKVFGAAEFHSIASEVVQELGVLNLINLPKGGGEAQDAVARTLQALAFAAMRRRAPTDVELLPFL